MLLHPDPQSVLSIGFGVGNTLSALAQHQPDELICAELSPGAIEAAAFFPSNRNVLDTPNLKIEIEDGRNYLLTCNRRFDVIQLEPPEIHTAGVVNLYTSDFYELARKRLNDDGIICQWLNIVQMPKREMKMLMRTFVDAFPESSLWCGSRFWDHLLIGSPRPVRVRPNEMQARFRMPRIRADLAGIGIYSPQQLLTFHVLCPASFAEYVVDVPPISDDWTYVDFSVPQSREAGYGVFLFQTLQHVEPVEPTWRIRDRLELLIRRDSATCLIDDSGMSADEIMRFVLELDREIDHQVQLNRKLRDRFTAD